MNQTPRVRRRSHFFRVAVAAGCVASIACVGCGKKRDTQESAKPVAGEKATAGQSGAAPAIAPDPVVELLEPGAEPRAKMRIVAPAGTEQTEDLSMLMQMKMSLNGMSPPSPRTPRIHMPTKMKLTELRADGTRKITFDVAGVTVERDPLSPPELVSALESKLGTLNGMHGFVAVTDRGFNRDFGMEMPPSASPLMKQMADSMKQSMGQMVSPLPEQPVGVGAKWRVTVTTTLNDMKINQSKTYELVTRAGDAGTLKIDLTQTADPQFVQNSQVPPGTKLHLDSLASKGGGTQSFDLKKLMPTSAHLSLTTDSSMTADDGTKKQPMDLHMDMDIDLSEK